MASGEDNMSKNRDGLSQPKNYGNLGEKVSGKSTIGGSKGGAVKNGVSPIKDGKGFNGNFSRTQGNFGTNSSKNNQDVSNKEVDNKIRRKYIRER